MVKNARPNIVMCYTFHRCSADGWVKAWNPVNGQLITVLNSGCVSPRNIVRQCTMFEKVSIQTIDPFLLYSSNLDM